MTGMPEPIAPDETWYPASILPKAGFLVRAYWGEFPKFPNLNTYGHAMVDLKGNWRNERGEELVFMPRFWKPIEADLSPIDSPDRGG